jgi:two-component system sensor histidine kinase BaeS
LRRPEDYREAAQIINDEAVRMRGLVDDLLYLSQVEAGQVVLQPEPLNPSDLLRTTAERFRRRAALAGVAVDAVPGANPVTQADARRMEQAVANLIDNAVRHTPPGGRITLSSAAANGTMQLTVHNTGSYISPEALPTSSRGSFRWTR